jgi:thermitase
MRIRTSVLAGAAASLALAVPATASAASYDPDQVIVKPKAGVALEALGLGQVLGSIYGTTAKVVAVSGDPAAVAARLNRSPLVDYAEPDYVLRADATPNDPRFGELYGMQKISAPAGWDAAGLGGFPSTGGAKVGIVDTGIQTAHEDLAGKQANCAQSRGVLPVFAGSIREGSCADDNGHGTHVAGTISGNANNAKGVAGVAFNSPLAICRALGGPLGSGNTSDVANCIRWTKDKGAKVISMSLGGGSSTTLQQAVDYAWAGGGAGGAVLVAAAGNDGDATLDDPAACPNVVSVAATDQNDARASFSNANADVEVAAPGVDILSTYNNGGYSSLSGTSMATPHVAGVTAIIWNKYPTAAASTIRSKLAASVDDLGAAGRDANFGYGRVNLVKAAGS